MTIRGQSCGGTTKSGGLRSIHKCVYDSIVVIVVSHVENSTTNHKYTGGQLSM